MCTQAHSLLFISNPYYYYHYCFEYDIISNYQCNWVNWRWCSIAMNVYLDLPVLYVLLYYFFVIYCIVIALVSTTSVLSFFSLCSWWVMSNEHMTRSPYSHSPYNRQSVSIWWGHWHWWWCWGWVVCWIVWHWMTHLIVGGWTSSPSSCPWPIGTAVAWCRNCEWLSWGWWGWGVGCAGGVGCGRTCQVRIGCYVWGVLPWCSLSTRSTSMWLA